MNETALFLALLGLTLVMARASYTISLAFYAFGTAAPEFLLAMLIAHGNLTWADARRIRKQRARCAGVGACSP